MFSASTPPDEATAKLIAWRWPSGAVTCPMCDADKVTYLPSRRRFKCRSCRRQFSATTGTALHSLKLAPGKALAALEAAKHCGSSIALAARIGIQQRSAWSLIRRLHLSAQGMQPREDSRSEAEAVGLQPDGEAMRPC